MREALFDLLPKEFTFDVALDVGSATGKLARELSLRAHGSSVVALDLSKEMLTRARENSPGLFSAVASDLEELPFPDGSFQLVMSNLTYQWAASQRKALRELYRVLDSGGGGLVVMNTLTEGTLEELKESFRAAEEKLGKSGKREFMEFVNPSDLQSTLEDAGFTLSLFEKRSCVRKYKDMWELLRVLKGIGATNPKPAPGAALSAGALLKCAADIYKARFSIKGGVRATYKTVFTVARKPR